MGWLECECGCGGALHRGAWRHGVITTRVVSVDPAADEPVTVDELKEHARIGESAEDDLLGRLLVLAREVLARQYDVVVLPSTVEAVVTGGWRTNVPLALRAARSIEKVERLPPRGALREVLSGWTWAPPSLWSPLAGWPDVPDAFVVTYTAGWEVDELPEALRFALLMIAGHYYVHRTASEPGADLPFAIDALVNPYRLVAVGLLAV